MHKKKRVEDLAFWKALLSFQRFILISCSCLSMLMIVLGVVLRYLFHTDLYGIEEFIVIIAFWLYFMGGVYGSYEGSHIRADLLTVYIKNETVKSVLKLIELAISSAVGLVLTGWGFHYFMWGLERGARSPGWRIPLVISQCPIFIGFALMTFYFIYHLINTLRKTRALRG